MFTQGAGAAGGWVGGGGSFAAFAEGAGGWWGWRAVFWGRVDGKGVDATWIERTVGAGEVAGADCMLGRGEVVDEVGAGVVVPGGERGERYWGPGVGPGWI